MKTDTLSAVLMKMRLKIARSSMIDAGASVGLEFPAHDAIKFYAVLKGDCWVSVSGDRRKVHLLFIFI